MEYSIDRLAKMSGVTSRTLRHYDQIGLLRPVRKNSAGYRIYGREEVNRLQHILFFRALGVELREIGKILDEPFFDEVKALEGHLNRLFTEKERLECLIGTVKKTIRHRKENVEMSDSEKFKGLKKQVMLENEEKYGREIREKYGEDQVEASNEKFMNMKEEEYEAMETLAAEIREDLKKSVEEGASPDSNVGRSIAAKHKEWLSYTWPAYNREAHIGLCQMYIADPRFTEYYDKEVKGCALFLKEAVTAWKV